MIVAVRFPAQGSNASCTGGLWRLVGQTITAAQPGDESGRGRPGRVTQRAFRRWSPRIGAHGSAAATGDPGTLV
jgi:hypothetical protein